MKTGENCAAYLLGRYGLSGLEFYLMVRGLGRFPMDAALRYVRLHYERLP